MHANGSKVNINRGFTIVEILVCIAIVAALAALIFVAMAPARERARQTVCTSNLKQLWTAYSLYRTDYDGIDPNPGDKMNMSQIGLPTGFTAINSFLVPLSRNSPSRCPDWRRTPDRPVNPAFSYSALYNVIPDGTKPSWIKEGSNHGLLACFEHNVDPQYAIQRTFDPFRVIVIRLNGRITNSEMPAGSVGDFFR